MGTSGSHTHTQLQGQMFTVTMLRHSGGPDMVEWPSQVKQMQSLWPEWMWHPEMWFTIILPCLFFQFISPLSSFLLLFPLCFFLLHLQHHLYLAPHFSFMFLFSALLFPLFFLFDPSVKAPLWRPVGHLVVMTGVCCSAEVTPDLAGLYFSLYFLSQLQPYLATQPRCFSSASISSCKGQPETRVRGINRYLTDNG